MRRVRIAGWCVVLCGLLILPWILSRLVPFFHDPIMMPQNVTILTVLGILVMLAGAALVAFGNRIEKYLKKNGKKILGNLLLLGVSIVICVIVGDALYNLAVPKKVLDHPKYGWDIPENLSEVLPMSDVDGREYEITRHSYKYGFRRWGNPETDKVKIFILGDSITETQNSNEDAYYAVLEQRDDVELFVKGVGGWGTLQEYLALNDTIDEIKPDIVVVQMHSNDVMNNDYSLESRFFRHNNRHWRPYIENGTIVNRDPMPLYAPQFVQHFRLIRAILLKIRNGVFFIEYKQGKTLDRELAEQGPNHPEVQQALKTTKDILGMIKERSGDAPVYLILVDGINDDFKLGDSYDDISSGFKVIPGVQAAVVERSSSMPVYIGDGFHWNAAGNKIAGDVINEYLDPTIEEISTK